MIFTITPQGSKASVFQIVSDNAADALEIVRRLAEGGENVSVTVDDGTPCDIKRLVELEQIFRSQKT